MNGTASGHLFTAVCVAGLLRTFLDPAVQHGYRQFFHHSGYEYFLSSTAAVQANDARLLLTPLRGVYVDGGSRITADDKTTQNAHGGVTCTNGTRTHFHVFAQVTRFVPCYQLIVGVEEARRMRYDWVMHTRTDLLILQPMPSAAAALGGGRWDLVLFYDLMGMAARSLASVLLLNPSLAYRECQGPQMWSRACGRRITTSMIADLHHKAFLCPPMNLIAAYYHRPLKLKQCRYPWSSLCPELSPRREPRACLAVLHSLNVSSKPHTTCSLPPQATPSRTSAKAHERGGVAAHALRTSTDMQGALATRISKAIAVTVHPPKFAYALDMVDSWETCGQHAHFVMVIVFSSDADLGSFRLMLQRDRGLSARLGTLITQGALRFLVVSLVGHNFDLSDAEFMRDPSKTPRNPIRMFKGFRSLIYIFDTLPQITHALLLDADTEFTSTANWEDYFETWSRQRLVLGGLVQKNEDHDANCEAIGIHNSKPSLYYWWQDAPVYERTDFQDFVRRVNLDNASIVPWDHIAYGCFNVEVRGWTPINVSAVLGHVYTTQKANLSEQELVVQKTAYHSFLWSRVRTESRLLQFHIDRGSVFTGGKERYSLCSTLPGQVCQPQLKAESGHRRRAACSVISRPVSRSNLTLGGPPSGPSAPRPAPAPSGGADRGATLGR